MRVLAEKSYGRLTSTSKSQAGPDFCSFGKSYEVTASRGWLQAAVRCAGSLDGEGPIPFFVSISEEISVMMSPTGSGSTKVIAALINGLSNICLNCFIC